MRVVSVIVVLAVASCAHPASGAADPAVLCGPARVVDGDTLEIAGRMIRLHGIDAPEAAQDCAGPEGGAWPCGQAATRRLEALVAGGRVACTARDTDRYGRLIAVCRRDGRDLNAALVAQGFALAYRRYATDYVAEERTARTAGRGIWRGRFTRPELWRAGLGGARTQPDRDCRVKGNVSANGRIYHLPGSRWYARTRIEPEEGERWFCSAAEAERSGWRAPRG